MSGMSDYDASTYGEHIADIYDAWVAGVVETDPAVALLAGLAQGRPTLELGIGTGRVALPLAERGVPVHGIDASKAMVARLRAKARGETLPVTLGDFADVAVDGTFGLVYVVFNTFFARLTQEAQVRCFRNVAARLAPDGLFVIEAFVPDVARFDRGQRVQASRVETSQVVLDVNRHDPVTETVASQHIGLAEGQVHLYPVSIRYAWPAELDLMARLAGLRLRDRGAGWHREPFTAASTRHVSVYTRA
jgi:SAM-dependent methyltransferase